jgi:SAM-dependent methyltransferase
MAQAFPNSRFVGFDYHPASIERARERAAEAGVADRARFEVAAAKDYPGAGYDLVCIFDALHDMGDPVGAARHIRETLKPDGSFMLVEPFAHDTLSENLNPIGRLFYSASTLLCTPASLSQEVGLGLGAQAGEARMRAVAEAAGFGRFRRAAETPFNLVFDVRPYAAAGGRLPIGGYVGLIGSRPDRQGRERGNSSRSHAACAAERAAP